MAFFTPLEFDDPPSGTPAKAVPVRLACFAAAWSPELFALIAAADPTIGASVLKVWEYNEKSGHIGEVNSEFYRSLFSGRTDLDEYHAVEALPKDHFVWSDDLVNAFSDFIDSTSDRDTAHELGYHIRWKPALHKCDELISACAAMSDLRRAAPGENTIARSGSTWTLTLDGAPHNIKRSTGLVCICYLLIKPYKFISAADLDIESHPSGLLNETDGRDAGYDAVAEQPDDSEITEESEQEVPESSSTEEPLPLLKADEAVTERFGTSASIVSDFGDAGPAYDPEQINSTLQTLEKRLDIAKETGNAAGEASYREQIAQVKEFKKTNSDIRGKPRRVASDKHAIRTRVSIAIKRSIDIICAEHPALGEHLRGSIKTGNICAYVPANPTTWSSSR